MTSQISSHTHNTNEGDYEFGGVGVKGCCGKVRWNTVRQGEIWINGVFCEDEFLPSSFNSTAMNFCSHPEPCISEHSEVDWISKEIAFQELICNDKPNHWLDTNNGRGDCVIKEEHDIDIVSTLTAVAALFRDWCAVESDLSEQMVKDRFEKSSDNKDDRPRDWIWLNDTTDIASNSINVVSPMPIQDDTLQWTDYDIAWNKFVDEHPDSQNVDHNAAFCYDLVDEEMANCNSWDTQDKVSIHKAFSTNGMSPFQDQQYSENMNDIGNTCIYQEFGRANFSVIDSNHDNRLEPLVDIDRYLMFGSPSPVASRYSFGREGGGGCSTSVGDVVYPLASDTDFHFDAGSSLPNTNQIEASFHNNARDENNPGARKPEVMMHEALLYALSYMTLHDLLTMERVSRTMRDSVRSDVLLWQQLHIEPPTSKNFTDEVFRELSSRSKGQLQSLTLVECTRVTEEALEHVVSLNPRLTKLALPGCTRISADAVVRMVEILTNHKKSGKPGLKQLRVRNIYGLTVEHLEYLKNMMGVGTQFPSTPIRPQYYHNGHYFSDCPDERPIDVEECPKCSNVRIIYDCTRERCQQRRGNNLQECRACILCIVRCEECGRCINDNEFEETFSLDFLCSCCWLRLPKCTECNRPGCGRHADHFIRAPDTTFVCSDCCSSTGTTYCSTEAHSHIN